MMVAASSVLAPLLLAVVAAGADVELNRKNVKLHEKAVASGKEGVPMQGSTPRLSEEENLSKDIPSQHRCNSCKAVIFQLNEGFKSLGKRRLKGWEVEEVYERVCEGKSTVWQQYGAKEIKGTPELTGPGLLDPSPEPGEVQVTTTGGVWADRLQMACLQMVEEAGEGELYKQYVGDGSYPGLDEFAVCVSRPLSRREYCQEDELEYLNRKISGQTVLDAGKQTHSTNSRNGFQPKVEANRVAKPLESSSRKGKGASKKSGEAVTTTTTTTTTTTSSQVWEGVHGLQAPQKETTSRKGKGGGLGKSAATSTTTTPEHVESSLAGLSPSEQRQHLLDEITLAVHALPSEESIQKVLSFAASESVQSSPDGSPSERRQQLLDEITLAVHALPGMDSIKKVLNFARSLDSEEAHSEL